MISKVVPWNVKPFLHLDAERAASALSPNAGLLLMTSIERTATVGIRSN